jgi:hypothetical protein
LKFALPVQEADLGELLALSPQANIRTIRIAQLCARVILAWASNVITRVATKLSHVKNNSLYLHTNFRSFRKYGNLGV